MRDKLSNITYQLAKKYTDEHGGGGGGTTNYNALTNKPQVNGVELKGSLTSASLNIKENVQADWEETDTTAESYINNKPDVIEKSATSGLIKNDGTVDTTEYAEASVVEGILDGTSLASFGDVETALEDKVDKNGTDRLMTASEGDKLDDLANIKSIGSGLSLNTTTGELTATGISITIDTEIDDTSTNPVQNKVIAEALDDKADATDIPTALSDLTDDATHRLVTDTEKTTWNGKADSTDIPDSLDDLADDEYHRTVTDAEKSTWNGKADVSAIPTTTSELTNDSGFITNTVNNLTNYYLSSQTYSKSEVDSLISAITTLDIEVVQTLPTQDISQTTIYLVPKSTAQTSNTYDEYINTTGTSAGWEKIGDTEIDLTNYIQKSATAGLVKNDGTIDTVAKASQSSVDAILDGTDIDSFGDVEAALADKVDLDDLASEFIVNTTSIGMYSKGDYVHYNGQYYRANADTDTRAWDSTKWDLIGFREAFDKEIKVNSISVNGMGVLPDVNKNVNIAVPDITGKADKVSNATNGNFAGLDANGNLTDSGIASAIVPSNASSSNKLVTANDLSADATDLQYFKKSTMQFTASSSTVYNKICHLTENSTMFCPFIVKLEGQRINTTATVQEISGISYSNNVQYTFARILDSKYSIGTVPSRPEYNYLIVDANDDVWVCVASYSKAKITVMASSKITIDGTSGTPVAPYKVDGYVDADSKLTSSVTSGSTAPITSGGVYTSLQPRPKTFTGTTAQWNSLTTAQKKEFDICNITDDEGSDVVDAVTDGDMRPVTSNAVRDVIYLLEDVLKWRGISGTPVSPVTASPIIYYNAMAVSSYFSVPAGEYTCNQLYSDRYYARLCSYSTNDVKTAFPGAENVAVGNAIGTGRYVSNQSNTLYTCYLYRYNASTWYLISSRIYSSTSGTIITLNSAEYLCNPHYQKTGYYNFPEI